jgi:hypothetical protein
MKTMMHKVVFGVAATLVMAGMIVCFFGSIVLVILDLLRTADGETAKQKKVWRVAVLAFFTMLAGFGLLGLANKLE